MILILRLSLFLSCFFASTLQAEELLKIGVILPLTGEAASYGEQFKKGIELNPNSKSFKLIYEDSKFDPKDAITAFYKLVDKDQVAALISFGGATCPVINAAAQKKSLLHLAAGCNTDSFKEPVSFNFRLDVNEAIAAEKTADYLVALKINKVAFVYVNNSWGESIIRQTEQAFHKVGIKGLSKVTFESAQSIDLKTAFAKLVLTKPQVVFLISLPNLTPIVLRQLHEAAYQGQIMSNISVENPAVISLAGKDAEGIFYLAVKAEPRSKSISAEFNQAFPEGNPFAAWGFDSVLLLSRAFATGSPVEFMQTLKDFVGTFNTYNFTPNGELSLSYEIREIKGGRYVGKSDLK